LVALAALFSVGFVTHLLWLHSKKDVGEALLQAGGWLHLLENGGWLAALVVFGPSLGLLALVVALLVHYGLPEVWQTARGPLQLGAVLGACLVAAWFVGSSRLDGLVKKDWLLFLPVVPPTLLAFQALVSWRQRPRSVGEFTVGVSQELRDALEKSCDIKRFEAVHTQLVMVFGGVMPALAESPGMPQTKLKRRVRYGSHNPTSFATQFAVPGLLLLLVGFGVMALAYGYPDSNNPMAFNPLVGRGLRWGAAGAYCYVLFTFGARSFRNDLTVGAATWAIITLITGPTLAVVLALAWKMKAPSEELADWQGAVVLFFAGVAPRRVMSIIESVALRFLQGSSDVSTSKLVPLTTLRGISPDLALRLREENIEDVVGLAYADPIRLVQALPYDLRQVVEWIDQAQLAVGLPDQYETLTQRGVTGAIDLGWRWLQACADANPRKPVIEHLPEVPQRFKDLAQATDVEARLVYDAARQMFYEEQVRLLWVMYNCFSTTAGDPSPSSPIAAEAPLEAEDYVPPSDGATRSPPASMH
jgi:hypothetical protein